MRNNVRAIYQLTPMQEGIYYHQMLGEGNGEYNILLHADLKGNVDEELFRKSLYTLAEKYEILKTAFVMPQKSNKVWQVILEDREIEFTVKEEMKASIIELEEKELARGFDLEKDSLLRIVLIKRNAQNYSLIWIAHHIIMDGWCNTLLLRDFLNIYGMYAKGCSADEVKDRITEDKKAAGSYQKYVKWLDAQDQSNAVYYWKNLLADYNTVAEIIPMQPVIKADPFDNKIKRSLPAELAVALKSILGTEKVTLSNIMEMAWAVLLHKHIYSEDIVFGKTVSGRNVNVPGVEQMVGLFINTIPVRVRFDRDTTFMDVVRVLKRQALEGMEYENCPLSEIQIQSSVGSNLIRTLVVFENYYVDKHGVELAQQNAGFEVALGASREETNYPLNFIAMEDDGICFELVYKTDIFCREEIERLADHIINIMNRFVQDRNAKITECSIIDSAEYILVTEQFSQPEKKFEIHDTIVSVFENTCKRYCDRLALVGEEVALTYDTLNQKANRMARHLRNIGVKQDQRIALLSSRSVEAIIAILAVWKAGAAYVPMDPSQPVERINYMLKDSKAELLLVNNVEYETEIRTIDIGREGFENMCKEDLPGINTPEDLAYMIYTSGTSGKPKGVMVEHRGVINLSEYFRQKYIVSEKDRILQFANIVFDASVWEITMGLLTGASLYVVKDEIVSNPVLMSAYLKNNKITAITMPPQYFDQLDQLSDTLRLVITAGSAAIPESIHKLGEHTQYINAYGPTEATVGITDWYYAVGDSLPKRIPIGRPIFNTEIFILNGKSICGIGMPGELCVKGIGVARGYCNLSELTMEKFEISEGERIYHTGDLARWTLEGDIDFMGRLDKQVKIRGFRIEPAEIENVLKTVEHVTDAAVIIRTIEGNDYICAYYVLEAEIKEDEIRRELKKKLVDYMIPTFFMAVEAIPVNLSGKVDQKKLPDIDRSIIYKYEEPEGEAEKQLAVLYSEVLKTKEIGRNTDFFAIGGQSIKAMQLTNLINRTFESDIVTKDIFRYPVLKDLADYIVNKSSATTDYTISHADIREAYPMSYQQKSIYTFWYKKRDTIAYNMPAALKINKEYTVEQIENAIRQIVDANEILRTHFCVNDGEFLQIIEEKALFGIDILEAGNVSERFRTFVKPFDLEKDMLLRAAFMRREDADYLFIDMHHIISDGKSVNLLILEFLRICDGEKAQTPEFQYKDYSEWMLKKDLLNQKAYYKELLAGELPVIDLPLKQERLHVHDTRCGVSEIFLDNTMYKRIQCFSKEYQVTEYMIFLASLMIVLGKLSNREDVIIGSPVYGRTVSETETMLGMFVNTVVMRGYPRKDKNFKSFLSEIKDVCLKSLEYQEYPFAQLVEDLDMKRSDNRNPVFDIMLVMQNHDTKMPELQHKGIEVIKEEITQAKFDLNFDIKEADGGYQVVITYNSSLYADAMVAQIGKYYKQMIETIILQPSYNIGAVSLCDSHETEYILKDIQGQQKEYQKTCVHELFQKQALDTPDRIAVIEGDRQLTYDEFSNKVNRMANKLIKLGVGTGSVVPVIGHRTAELLVGIFAVLKTGACYVPVDPLYPRERINYILKDTGTDIVLTDAEENDKYAGYRYVLMEEKTYAAEPADSPKVNVTPEALAYIIYTSGTTGHPKGVMISHSALMNYVMWGSATYFDPAEVVCMPLFTSIAFDLTVTTIYIPLLSGNTVIVYPEEYAVEKICRDNRIRIAKMTPSHLMMLKEIADNSLSIRKFILGGEQLLSGVADSILDLYGNDTVLFNEYGPTEATVGCMIYAYDDTNRTQRTAVSIGYPISNVKTYIMQDDVICGMGQIGELCIAGPCLADGYRNLSEITKKAFVNNPYMPYERMYRTGDIVRRISKDDMEYIGRKDEQVKIHGYRIELGEIENILLKCEEIQNAAVICKGESEKYLCAFIVKAAGISGDITNEVRNKLSGRLPNYMIPRHIVCVDKIPITVNGKVNKHELQKFTVTVTENEYKEPCDEVEKLLVKIFASILGLDKMSVEDDFLEYGGDSIQAIRIVSKCREAGYELTLSDLMQYRTVSTVRPFVKKVALDTLQQYQYSFTGDISLSPVIKKYLEKDKNIDNKFQQAMLLETEKEVDTAKLESAFKLLVNYHDMLRLIRKAEGNFKIQEMEQLTGEICNEITLEPGISLQEAIIQECEKTQQQIDIEHGVVIKVLLMRIPGRNFLFVCAHHMVIDGVSWRILLNDFLMVYGQMLHGEDKPVLPRKTAPYNEWVSGLENICNTYEFGKEKDYWIKLVCRILECGLGKEEVDKKAERQQASFSLSAEETDRLFKNCERSFNMTANDVLLNALSMAVFYWRGDDRISVNLESHGRDALEGCPVDRTVGWFTTIYPVLLEYDGEKMLEVMLKNKDHLHRIRNNGIGYGILRYFEKEDVVVEPEFVFNHFGVVDIEIDGDFKISSYLYGNAASKANDLWSPCTLTTWISAGQLQVDIQTQSMKYSRSQIDALAGQLNQAIMRMTEFSDDAEGRTHSVSDFNEDEWDNDELLEVLNAYEWQTA